MTYTDPGAPQYEYDWQNPDHNTFDFGRVFSRSFDILKRRGVKMALLTLLLLGLPFFLIALWPMLIEGGFQGVIESNDPGAVFGGISPVFIALAIVVGLLSIIASLWLQPALIKISYGALTNEDEPMLPTLKQVSRFVLPVLGFYILYILAVMLGLILLVIPALFVGLGWMLGAHVIVLEEQGVMDSISRSWNMTKGYKRWLLLLAIVFGIISFIVTIIISIPIYIMGDPNVAMMEGASPVYWIINGIVSAFTQVIGSVIGMAWGTAAYVEIRKVTEGVDPESQVDVFN